MSWLEDTCSLFHSTSKGHTAVQYLASTLGALVIIPDSCVTKLAFEASQQPPVARSPANGGEGRAGRAGRHNEKVTDEYLSPKGKNIWIKVSRRIGRAAAEPGTPL